MMQISDRYAIYMRGGRLTKWKGKVASCAPSVGLVLGASAALLFATETAFAADECGAEAVGPDVITCSGGAYPTGITYINSDGLTLILSDPTIVVGPVAGAGVSIITNATTANAAVINATHFGSITTTGNSRFGLEVRMNGLGEASVTLGNGSITTGGTSSHGVLSFISNAANTSSVAATMLGGTVNTSNGSATGVRAHTIGTGGVTTTLEDGTISTTGSFAHGILALNDNAANTSAIVAVMNDGSIQTINASAAGIRAQSAGTGVVSTALNGGTVSTSGIGANALFSLNNNLDNTNVVTASVTGGSATASGVGANGVFVRNDGATGTFDVDITGGTVTGGSGLGAAVRTAARGGGTLDIGAGATLVGTGATLDGPRSGIAIRDGDSDSGTLDSMDGVDRLGGDVIVTTSGTILGDAILGLGDDTLNLTGGSFTGDIYGDDTIAAALDGNDTFNWSGGTFTGSFFGGNGSDTVTISASGYDGTTNLLDGGDDHSTADGWNDLLTFDGVTADAYGTNLLNWERIVIDGGAISILDGALTVGAEAGTGLTLVNGGVLNGGATFTLTGNMTTSAGGAFHGFGGGTGTYAISGNLTNDGTLSMQDGAAGDITTVAGDYAGTGTIYLDANIAVGTADRLVIAGDASGTTLLALNNLAAGASASDTVTLVTVAGLSDADNFALAGGTMTLGGFDFDLEYQTGSFVLAGEINSTGRAYMVAPMILGDFNFTLLPTLQQRVGQRQWGDWNALAPEGLSGAWLRFDSDQAELAVSGGDTVARSYWGLQTGYDFAATATEQGQWVMGVTAQYGQISGEMDSDAFGIGATATWYGQNGVYADIQGQVNWITSDFASSAAGTLAEGAQSRAISLSIEGGERIALGADQVLVPQAQLFWGKVDGATFTDEVGNAVDLGSNVTMIGRIGLAYEYETKTRQGDNARYYAIGNLLHNFSKDSSVAVAGADITTDITGTWAEVGVGFALERRNGSSLYGEFSYRNALGDGDGHGIGFTIGLNL